MRQTLFHVPYEMGGVRLFGVGVLLALWVALSLFLFWRLARKQGLHGDTWSYVVPLALVGAAIGYLPTLFPDGLPIRGYGVMVLLGAVAGIGLAAHRAHQMGVDGEVISSLAVWLFVPGMIGARLFHVIEYWESEYRQKTFAETLKAILNVPQGGLVVYGALIGAAIGFVLFVRKHNLPGLALADVIAPSLALGLALGRIGCLLNGCCYGGRCEKPWAVTFPPESPPYQSQVKRGQLIGIQLSEDAAPIVIRVEPGSSAYLQGLKAGNRLTRINGKRVPTTQHAYEIFSEAYIKARPLNLLTSDGLQIRLRPITRPRSLPVHPTQIYSAVTALLICFVLWCYYPFRRRDGEVIALLLSIYPMFRWLLEKIRIDEPAQFDTQLSISQIISLVLLVAIVLLWWYILQQPKGSALPKRLVGQRHLGGG